MNIILYRFCAKLIDILSYVLLMLGLNLIFPNLNIWVLNIIMIIFYLIWFILLPYYFQVSLGKKMLGIKISPKLTLLEASLREPFNYMMILIVLATIIYPFNINLASYVLIASLLVALILLILFYFKKDFWNKLNHCQVVEK